MTHSNGSESRLDRLEALADTVLLAVQQQNGQIGTLRESIAAQGGQIREQGGQIDDLRAGIAEVVAMLSEQAEQQEARHAEADQRFENLLQDARADRQRMDEFIERSDQRFENLLQDARADRQRMDEFIERSDQRFENLLQDARTDRLRIDQLLERSDRDRALIENEHRAFRETFQTLLAEVARIWQRLAG
jgi:hypothetical protein